MKTETQIWFLSPELQLPVQTWGLGGGSGRCRRTGCGSCQPVGLVSPAVLSSSPLISPSSNPFYLQLPSTLLSPLGPYTPKSSVFKSSAFGLPPNVFCVSFPFASQVLPLPLVFFLPRLSNALSSPTCAGLNIGHWD